MKIRWRRALDACRPRAGAAGGRRPAADRGAHRGARDDDPRLPSQPAGALVARAPLRRAPDLQHDELLGDRAAVAFRTPAFGRRLASRGARHGARRGGGDRRRRVGDRRGGGDRPRARLGRSGDADDPGSLLRSVGARSGGGRRFGGPWAPGGRRGGAPRRRGSGAGGDGGRSARRDFAQCRRGQGPAVESSVARRGARLRRAGGAPPLAPGAEPGDRASPDSSRCSPVAPASRRRRPQDSAVW